MVSPVLAVTLLAACLAQGRAETIQMLPYESYGDLNMPGFMDLNVAINSGSLDVSPSLTDMPSVPKKSLADVISQVLGDLAHACAVRRELELAASLRTLQGVSTEFEQLAVVYNKVTESWNMVEALRAYSYATIELRSQLELTIEVVQGAVTPLILDIQEQIVDLGNEPELIEVQKKVKTLVENFDLHFSKQVSNTAEVLRGVSRLLSDMLNYRVNVPVAVDRLYEVSKALQTDLEDCITQLQQETSAITSDLKALETAGIIERYELLYIAASVGQVKTLLGREVDAMSGDVVMMTTAAYNAYTTLQNFF